MPGEPRAEGGGSRGLPPYEPAEQLPAPAACLPPLPELEELARDFGERGDGTVELFGRVQRVTAGISRFGMQKLYDEIRLNDLVGGVELGAPLGAPLGEPR